MMLPQIMLLAATGACGGSFMATLGLRVARGQTWAHGRSSCDHCAVSISYARSLPVVSYALCRGRCAQCGGSINPIHPLGEALGAILLPACVLTLGPLEGSLVTAAALLLLASSIVDILTMRLPNALTALLAVVCAALSLTAGSTALLEGVVASAAVFIIIQGLRLIRQHLRQEPGVGFGDVKLLAALALWLGFTTPWAVAAAAIFGLATIAVLKPAHGRLPFGPFIAVAGLAVGLASTIGAGGLFS